MNISEVAEKFGISADTLRFYEKEGLIASVPRTSGARNYGEKEIENIEFIICMRNAGLSVSVLKEYMNLIKEGDKSIEIRKKLLSNQRKLLKQKLEEMQKAYDRLNYKIEVFYPKLLEKEKNLLKQE